MFQKFAILAVMAVVAIAASGCAGAAGGPFSSMHYGGEGMIGGAAAGGITAAAATNFNPLWTAVGIVTGGITGALTGGQIAKGPGIQERDMGLQAKQFALLQECRRGEWQKVEQSVRYSQVYGGKPADYYQPDYNGCDRIYTPAVTQQPRNIDSVPRYTPQFNIQKRPY